MHEKRFHGDASRLRSPERIARLSVDAVVATVTEGLADDGDGSGAHTSRALDIGTGTALFAEQFAERGFSVSGADADSNMVALASGHVPSGTFVQAVAESLPFDADRFDLVFMGFVLHETDDPVLALREAARVSRNRVAILEWPYRDGEVGPPIAHRLRPENVLDWMKEVGLSGASAIEMGHVVLYIGSVAG